MLLSLDAIKGIVQKKLQAQGFNSLKEGSFLMWLGKLLKLVEYYSSMNSVEERLLDDLDTAE